MSHIPEPDETPQGPAYEGRLLVRPEDEVVDQGAGFDLTTLLSRRHVLSALGIGAGALALAACSSGGSSGGSGSSSSGGTATATATGEIPEETNGPYPADGTNGVTVLDESGIVRSDVTSSLDGGTVAEGVPLSFTFTLTDLSADGAPLEGAALYLWQCDAAGRYSMYSDGVEDETYLRGIQVADADGSLTFSTIVPACYTGRWPHLHFEVYPDADSATSADNAIATSQVAFPEDVLADIYALDAYAGSTENLDQVSLDTDNVFSDGYELEMATMTGDASSGFVGSLAVAIDPTTEAGVSGGGGGAGGGGEPPSGGAGGTPPSRGDS